MRAWSLLTVSLIYIGLSGLQSSASASDLTLYCQMLRKDSDGQERHFNVQYDFDFGNGTVTGIETWAGGPLPAKTHKYVSFDANRVILYQDDIHYGEIVRATGKVYIKNKTENLIGYDAVIRGDCTRGVNGPRSF